MTDFVHQLGKTCQNFTQLLGVVGDLNTKRLAKNKHNQWEFITIHRRCKSKTDRILKPAENRQTERWLTSQMLFGVWNG